MTPEALNPSAELPAAPAAETPQPASRAEPYVEQPYWNPYLAGFGLGLVLLTAFVTMGRGLGGSSAFSAAAGACVTALAPGYSSQHGYWAEFVGANPFKEWLVFEVMGVFVGGLISGLLANRAKLVIEHGPRWTNAKRLTLAFFGGGLMALGAKLGSGCTSGQALTGGSLLNAGSWAFMGAMFVGAYAIAWFFRKQWV